MIPYYETSNSYLVIQSPFRNININHIIVSALKDKLYLREQDTLVDFFISLMYFANDETNFENIHNGKVAKTMKRIGCKYIQVDWSKYPESYMPDYHIFIQKYGDIKLSDVQFRIWACTETKDLVD